MVRSGSHAIGIVVALAACLAGCAVQQASNEEMNVDTAGQSTANVVVPRVTTGVSVQDNPCLGAATDPQPWNCRPTNISGPHSPNTATQFGYETMAPGATQVPNVTYGPLSHPKE
jgi:hypothetical protein